MGCTLAICLQITLTPKPGSSCGKRTIWYNAICSYKAVSSLIGYLLGITVQLRMTLYLAGKNYVLCFSCYYSHTGCRSMIILYGELPSPIPQPYRHILSFVILSSAI